MTISTSYDVFKDRPVDTDPTEADTDGDGYWDGWIGVHDGERTDNVVLYMEHLHDDDNDDGETDEGVQGEEVVSEQAEVHPVDRAPSPFGADLPGRSDEVHSNLHVGEFQWETDPLVRRDAPSPSLSLEVDFYEDANYGSLAKRSWADGIEENYALYGIDMEVIQDETLTDDDFELCTVYDLLDATIRDDLFCVYPDNGFGYREIVTIAANNHSTGADEYVVVLDQAGGAIPNGEDQSGVNLFAYPYQAIFTTGNEDDAAIVSASVVADSPYQDGLAMVAAKTQIHEIGHSFHVGEADDKSLLEDPVRKFTRDGEVYSGTSADDTPEELNGFDEWSIMRSGWSAQVHNPPMEGRYFVFSVEEISTVGEPR